MFGLSSKDKFLGSVFVLAAMSNLATSKNTSGATMKLFNAIQLVILFAVMPFIDTWLWSGPFHYSFGVFILAVICHLLLFGWLVFMVWSNFCEWSKS